MQLAMIGLGRMGGNMVRAADAGRAQGRRVRPRAPTPWRSTQRSAPASAKDLGGRRPRSSRRRASSGSWCRPASRSMRRSTRCCPALSKGDIIIDGGNSNFHDSIRRAAELKRRRDRVHRLRHERRHLGARERLLPDGRRRAEAVKHCEPIFTALAPADGYAHVGPPGAGPLREDGAQRHRVRRCCRRTPRATRSCTRRRIFRSSTSQQIAEVWQHGSVVRSWLNELAASAFAKRRRARRRSRAASPIRAKGAGRCRKRSTSTCRRR